MKLFPDVSNFVKKNQERNAEPKSSMHSLELVITVVIFFLIGRLIDSSFDTTPIFTIVFGVVGVVGSFLSAYYRYILTSKKLDADKAWSAEKVRIAAPIETESTDELIVPKGYGQDD